jgi:hypothetical protein
MKRRDLLKLFAGAPVAAVAPSLPEIPILKAEPVEVLGEIYDTGICSSCGVVMYCDYCIEPDCPYSSDVEL